MTHTVLKRLLSLAYDVHTEYIKNIKIINEEKVTFFLNEAEEEKSIDFKTLFDNIENLLEDTKLMYTKEIINN